MKLGKVSPSRRIGHALLSVARCTHVGQIMNLALKNGKEEQSQMCEEHACTTNKREEKRFLSFIDNEKGDNFKQV